MVVLFRFPMVNRCPLEEKARDQKKSLLRKVREGSLTLLFTIQFPLILQLKAKGLEIDIFNFQNWPVCWRFGSPQAPNMHNPHT